MNWRKAWQTVDKFYINNKVKEVSFKIMHRIYPDMLDSSLQLRGFDVIMYFGDHGFDKDKAYFIQLLMGKFHIHKMKWSGSKPNFSHFINNFNLCCKALCNCTKAIRSFVILILFIFKKYIYFTFECFSLYCSVVLFRCVFRTHGLSHMREVNVELVRFRPHSFPESILWKLRVSGKWSMPGPLG